MNGWRDWEKTEWMNGLVHGWLFGWPDGLLDAEIGLMARSTMDGCIAA